MIIAILTALCIPISVLGFLYYTTFSDYTYRNESEDLLRTVQNIAEQVSDVFEVTTNLTRLLSNSNSINYYVSGMFEAYPNMINVNTTFSQLILPYEYIQSVYVYSNAYSGYSFRMGSTSLVNIESKWIEQCRNNNGEPVWSGVQKVNNQYTDIYVFSVYKLISLLETQAEIGILRLNIYEDYLSNLFLNTNLSNISSIYLISETGEILSSINNALVGTTLIDKDLLSSIDSHSGYIDLNFEGSRQLAFYSNITSINANLIAFVPYNTVIQENLRYRKFLFWLLLLCSFAGSVLALVLARSFSQPIDYLCSEMDKVGQGNFTSIQESKRKDEFGLLHNQFISMVRNIDSLFKRIVILETKNREAELIALQSRINPHFLHNTLNAISWLTYSGKSEEASAQIQALSDMFKHMLNNGCNITTLRNEVKHINDYNLIISRRFPNRFVCNISITEGLLECCLPNLILQPLLENSIYHGFKDTEKQGIIRVEALLKNDIVLINVEDNGCGVDENIVIEKIYDTSSNDAYALRNINDRIKLYCGNQYGLTFHSKPGKGTNVTICIPYITEPAKLSSFETNK